MKYAQLGLLFLGSFGLFAQNNPLITIGEDVVTADEFINIYQKNRDVGRGIDPKSPTEYLDLYVNFKLKVKEAKEQGLDTVLRFQREFGNYRAQLAAPYLSDKSMDTLLVKEAYNRMKEEIRASHIMFECAADALPEDTLAAFKKAADIKARIEKGEMTFEAAASEMSVDRGTAVRGGDLGYFTAFTMVYPFESAAYNTKVGQISDPVRSQYGYHLVKVADRRPASGKVTVAHIFIASKDTDDTEAKMAAQKKAMEIHHRIKMGDDFAMTAKQHSDDKASAANGGLLDEFGINTMMTEFEEAAFGLKQVGDFTQPIKTAIGYHIIKLVDKKGVPTFEEAEQELFKKVSRDSRSSKGRDALLARLKSEYNLKENTKRLKEFEKVVDQSYLEGNWDAKSAAKLNKPLFEFADKVVNQTEFTNYLANQMRVGRKSQTPRAELYKQYQAFVDATIMAYEDKNLEKKYPKFRYLVHEYRDGILLFDLTETRIWNKAVEDTAGLQAFYEANKTNYMWDERVNATVFNCETEKVAKDVRKQLKAGKSNKEIVAKVNSKSELSVSIEEGVFSKGRNQTVDQVNWELGTSANIAVDGRVHVVHITAILPPQPKKLEEAKGLITSDYQKELEKAWVEELKSKYTVKINEATLAEVIKTLN
ncbi:MAG: peptidylprolyl isomerase [Schleiferiaceae bacterium]|nr:peptidylprolyl isomerase [Schleiferiaceae bacterium]